MKIGYFFLLLLVGLALSRNTSSLVGFATATSPKLAFTAVYLTRLGESLNHHCIYKARGYNMASEQCYFISADCEQVSTKE